MSKTPEEEIADLREKIRKLEKGIKGMLEDAAKARNRGYNKEETRLLAAAMKARGDIQLYQRAIRRLGGTP